MDARINMVTLGVKDVARSRAFYERLGFRASSASNPQIAFFNLSGVVLALYGRNALAEEVSSEKPGEGFSSTTLAQNRPTREEVNLTLQEAKAAGGRIVKPAQDTFWGGYSGYFADPDGHHWEVAWNPHFPLDEAGRIQLPE
jgi:predicted lactoylglutathione lyase